MTVRARPVVRSSRPRWRRPDRNALINIGFGLVVLVAVIVLVAYTALGYYTEHLSPVAYVNGQSITRDEFTRRYAVEQARLLIAESRVHDEVNAGRLTREQGDAQVDFLGQRREQLPGIALERLIDARIEAELAREESVTVTDADVEAFVAEEATRPEQRHAWLIEVAPAIAEDAEAPTDAAKAEAKKKADQALTDLKAGKDWAEVAKAVSTDSTGPAGGDLGWVSRDFDPSQQLNDAVFGLQSGAMTEVLVDENGVARIARVTEIAQAFVDSDYRGLVAGRGAPTGAYDEAARQDALTRKLRETIDARALAEGPQKRVAEIFLEDQSLPEALPQGAVKTRHILFSPKDDPNGAGELPAEDPAWKEAEDAARKAYDTLKTRPDRFDELARKESDEGGAETTGGKLPWFDPGQVEAEELDRDFGAAIFKAGLQPGQILEPVKSGFGWHVIQILYFPTDEAQATKLKTEIEAGTLKFEDAVRDYSVGQTASEGGEIGWVARFQLDRLSEDAIFATPVNSLTAPVVVDGDGVHLYKILEEATRAPDDEQKQQIEQSAYSNWYEVKKADFSIDRSPSTDEPA